MCGVDYTPYAFIDKSKIYDVAESEEAPPTGERGGLVWVTRGYPYVEERNVGK